ncbi:MAG: hypothetical protein JWM91_1546, partial [Rhodospirillales bacterium]|nr:hypothetical protein [Rhodospirillales bacterium]
PPISGRGGGSGTWALGRFWRYGIRAIVVAAIAVAAAIAFYMVHNGTIEPAAIGNMIGGNPLAPLIFILLQVIASLVFIPRTVLGIAAGLLFGFLWGSVLAILGAVAGAAAGFALWRWIGKGQVDLEAMPRLGPLIERAEQGGWRAVAIVRLVPIPHSVANTALALTKLRWIDYLVGSFLGMLPMTLFQVDVGVAGEQVLRGQGNWLIISLGLALLFGVSFLIKRAASRRT